MFGWDPFTIKLKQQLSQFDQKFALQVCLKQWNMPYCDILERTGLPRRELRRSLLKLSLSFMVLYIFLMIFTLSPIHAHCHAYLILFHLVHILALLLNSLFLHSPFHFSLECTTL